MVLCRRRVNLTMPQGGIRVGAPACDTLMVLDWVPYGVRLIAFSPVHQYTGDIWHQALSTG